MSNNIVLVHGYPLDATVFSRVVPLIEGNHSVLVPDLAGFGSEPWPPDGDLSMEAQADHVFRAMDHAGMPNAVVVGFSMGGYVALAMAEIRPERVSALGLVGSKSDADSDEAKIGRDAQAKTVVESGAHALVEPMTAALFGESVDLSSKARLRTMIESTRAETYVSALAGMRDRRDRAHVIAGFRGPFGLQVGTDDPVVSVERATAMAALAVDGSVEVLEGIGHMIPMESPADVAAFVNTLVARVIGA